MKKKLTGIAALLLCLALCLTGCGEISTPKKDREREETADREDEAETEREPGGAEDAGLPSAADYYRYLRDEVLEDFRGGEGVAGELSARHLAEVEPHEMKLSEGNFCEVMRLNNALLGVISAVVEDFDGDGVLEMLTIRATVLDGLYSIFSDALYTEADFSTEDVNRRVFHLYAELYDYRDGEICLDNFHSPGPVAELSLNGWGYMAAGLEKLDDGYYLYTSVYSEDLSTYGPSYGMVTGVSGQRPDYISAVPAYGLSEAEANLLFRREEIYDYSDTTIHDRFLAIGTAEHATDNLDRDADVFAEALGGGLLCFFNVAHPDWGGKTLIHTTTDYTGLRHYLKNDAADWEPLELPRGGKREVSEGPEAILEFAGEIGAAAGVELRPREPAEDNGVWRQSFGAQDCELTVGWSVSENRLVSAGVSSSQETPTEEWYAIKDAILEHPVFGWSGGEADFLKGGVKNWAEYINGVTVGDYTCVLGAVVNAFFSVSIN